MPVKAGRHQTWQETHQTETTPTLLKTKSPTFVRASSGCRQPLIDRTFDAARHGRAGIGIAGGVSANSRRGQLQATALREIPTFLPSLVLSTDNAAMIAAAGLRKLRAGITADLDFNADAALTL